MVATTEYKKYQLILELVSAVIYAGWFTAGMLIYNLDPPAEGEILKQNCMLSSLIATVLVFFLFSAWSVLPANNLLIKTKKYEDGEKEYRFKRESGLRTVALIIKLTVAPVLVLIGLYNYIII